MIHNGMTAAKPRSIVKLNIGGARFETTADTLTRVPDSFFVRLLSGTLGTTFDEHGAYFIDRDGQFFAPILTFLRSGEIIIPRGTPVEALRKEAEFYCLASLLKALDEQENPIIPPLPVGVVDNERLYAVGYMQRHGESILKTLHILKMTYGNFCTRVHLILDTEEMIGMIMANQIIQGNEVLDGAMVMRLLKAPTVSVIDVLVAFLLKHGYSGAGEERLLLSHAHADRYSCIKGCRYNIDVVLSQELAWSHSYEWQFGPRVQRRAVSE